MHGREAFEAKLTGLERHWALATVEHFVDHVDYAVGVIGVDHVGIGSDFEGGGGVTGWADANETVNVTTELLAVDTSCPQNILFKVCPRCIPSLPAR